MLCPDLHFEALKPHASSMDPLLLITHLAAAIGGVIIGVSLCRSRHL